MRFTIFINFEKLTDKEHFTKSNNGQGSRRSWPTMQCPGIWVSPNEDNIQVIIPFY